jgi:hypothetical protein
VNDKTQRGSVLVLCARKHIDVGSVLAGAGIGGVMQRDCSGAFLGAAPLLVTVLTEDTILFGEMMV